MTRPFVLLSVATSIDGYIDDTSSERLLLSNDEDFDRVDQVRSDVDAILIGAGTMRADNPRLIVKSPERRAARVARGDSEYPLKVTVTESGKLDSSLKFWHHGGEKVAYTVNSARSDLSKSLSGLAEVVSLGDQVDFGKLLDDLAQRGVRRLMVEGGGRIHTAFLAGGLVDEMQMVVAPIVVGESAAPRFLNPATYLVPRRMAFISFQVIDDVVLLRYAPKIEGTD
jgi:riboflavin-specific deaminase-like protein